MLMPTYDQLDNEEAWRDEIEPPALQALKAGIKRWRPGAGVGIKGDNNHLNGYHRSRRWISTSIWCTNRTYSVSRTSGDRSGGDANWCTAMDIWGIAQSDLHAMCKRLDAAVRAGRLEKITEWYGNFGGDTRVDGWDNIADRLASSDSSHLFHLHMSFDRGRADEDHSDVLAVLIGEIDVNASDVQQIWQNDMARNGRNMADNLGETWAGVQQANAKLDKLGSPAQVDIPALVAALRPELEAAAERAVRKVLGAVDE